jgi:uncharacterized protein with HEPN domain
MPRRANPALDDILETIDRIQGKLENRSFSEFEASWELRFLAQRAIEIISEASRRLPDDLKADHPEIRWKSIAGIGNVLRHEYHSVADQLIWNVLRHELPSLRLAVQEMAAKLENE